MPVVRQKAEEASEIQAGPPLNGNTLHHTLDLFHNHHELCSERRKNGVNYEISVEFERTKWLKRKYMDNLRQQQALTGRLDGPRAQLNSSSESADGSMDTFNLKQSPGLPDTPPSEKHQPGFASQKDIPTPNDKSIRSNGHSEEGSPSRGELGRYSKANGHHSIVDSSFATVAIKTEPNSAENTPTCLKSPPQPVAMASVSGNGSRALNRRTPPGSISLPGGGGSSSSSSINTPEPKRRKVLQSPRTRRPLPLRARSISSPDDPEDDLALSPGRFIHGELSTPPIKPLEEGDDPPITPSPPTSVRLTKSGESTASSSSSALTTTTSTVITGQSTRSQEPVVSVSPATSISRGGPAPTMPSGVAVPAANSNLSKDLHDFDQVMNQFTWEQSARERRDSFSSSQPATGVVMSHMQVQPQPPTGHVISPPPYFTTATSQAIRIRTPSSPQQYYHRPQSHVLHGRPSVETDPYFQMQFASPTHLPSSPHLPMHTQVVPTTSFSHPLHPQSPALMQPQRPPDLTFQQQRSMYSTQPPLLSPTVHTPISTHIATFPPNQGLISSATAPNGTMTSPNHPPHTPSTPLEHFNSFPPPPSCPTATQFPLPPPPPPPSFQSSLSSSTLTSGYQYTVSTSDGHTVLRSPTVSVAGMHWDGQHTAPVHLPGQPQLGGSSLRQALLSQVNSRVEALSGQKVPGGVPDPAAVAGLGYTSPKVTHSGMLFHMGSDLLLRRDVTGLTQPVAPQPGHFPASFTGASGPNLPQPHTISYQGRNTSFSHPH